MGAPLGPLKKEVAVIGGGIAGLVAARDCARLGLGVTVYEATDAVGGAVASHEVAGLTLDSGAESFAVRRGTVADFVDDLGLTDLVVAPNPAGAWLHLPADGGGSESHPLPKAGILGIPGSPLADDVRRVLGWRGAWRAWADRVIPVLKIGREHSLGELVEKRMGRRTLERLVEPIASGVYSAPANALELDVVAPGLNNALTTAGSLSGAVLALRAQAPAGSAVGGLRGGMSQLVAALTRDLDTFGARIRTETRVGGLRATGTADEPNWELAVEAPVGPDAREGAEPEVAHADFVIIATPAAAALDLLAPLGDDARALRDLGWPGPTVVHLATLVLDAPALDAAPRGTGVLVAAGTPGVSAKALTHVSAKWAWVAEAAGPGRHVLRLSYGRAGEPNPAAGLTDAEFEQLALRDAATILGVPLPPASVRGFARTIWGDALSPATVGARERVRQVRDAVADVPGLAVTGAWLSGTGLAAVIPDARDAAARIRRAAVNL
ncbi:protoporphyrinogen oxidase [Cryobacterium tepidiphilum]|uniref:Coproporphyrinogen III oxidase n=1 Tax=Cryobacterium tepidiphilum TaxID=2486026 RepID=A0A3M8LN96_9MICO|nr:protoporphyrinogen oxidase [Cryobacterium tepidiphilum]RNE66996.1 protoporphyrinogen oxidase [Cryobacterium tepidiphilum]